MNRPTPGTIRFHKWCAPPLAAGDYSIEMTQTVADVTTEALSGSLPFTVAGPRFALNPEDIYCVYPPERSTGNFSNSLPHIVFTRRTLPWERNRAAEKQPAYGGQWMALLLVDAEDCDGGVLPPLVQRTAKDLLVRPENVAGPELSLSEYELSDPCTTIDLDARLFRQIAPGADELMYLAHVREVTTDNKETLSFLADGWFSVVIGNRFPKRPVIDQEAGENQGKESQALLVSLEGMKDYLRGGPIDVSGKVRLAVLANWTFTCFGSFEFAKSMKDLDVSPLQIKPVPETGTPGEEYVSEAFNRGYAALNHNTRLGEKTVSWYRGPLTPVTIERRGRYGFAAVPDGLVRYDPESGLMDLTYAAASQLGRLLALQDRSFAQTLCAWRTKVQGQLDVVMQREELRRALNSGSTSLAAQESEFPEAALADALQGTAQKNPAVGDLSDVRDSGDGLTESDPEQDPPPSVCQWLARRLLLYGVPFSYLVPDARMLPTDSMRFFSLDPGWVKCLLEGCCSVGRNSTREQMVDEFLRARFFDLAVASSATVRERVSADGDAPAIAEITTSPASPKESQEFTFRLTGTNLSASDSTVSFAGAAIDSPKLVKATGIGTDLSGQVNLPAGDFIVTLTNNRNGLTSRGVPLTVSSGKSNSGKRESLTRFPEGFLLRSPMVKGWRGLEMEAKGTDDKPLTPLRIDRLSPDIMLCIFNGPLKTIEIRQPPEGMHFGATAEGRIYRKLILRKVLPDGAGDQIEHPVEIPFGAKPDLRVVDVKELAHRLHTALTKEGGMATNAPFESFTSAEFGVQMTESPGRAIITVRGEKK